MEDLLIENGEVLVDGRFEKVNILVKNGKITSLARIDSDCKTCNVLNASDKKIVPGFIDIHTHGGYGVDVNNATTADLLKLSRFFAAQGTTGWLASIVTDTYEQTTWCIGQIRQAMEEANDGAQILGIHLEGPFLSSDYKGSMQGALLRKADSSLFDNYQKAAKGLIKYITVSPEVDGAPEFIKEVSGRGVIVSIGHSGADYDTARHCIRNGAASATHTFNAMSLLHHHSPGICGAVLEMDVFCEAICDGIHLHPGIIRLLLKTKGIDKVIAVTDSIMAAGMPDGLYNLGASSVKVTGGDAKLISDGTRAGSTLTTSVALRNLVDYTGRNLEEVIMLLTANPASLLRIDSHKGSVMVGKDADFVLLDEFLRIDTTVVGGRVVFENKTLIN
ncbi:N-acetylglucosamine-6-phosphate deacetylase [Desulfosporosinus metallidurans]|uniref:N-acetylglucosamine-6-phosphate deacetylase n=1 Tax=Desulfosporosinus metallidurans TaxID=1888891 RepID=A0A1Q8QTW0_9FIRM|nr:N-acetylglucosamine-6-phosphate deacetylase [Desulfosporosinus metallidurans]OLN30791.1 N-acetylglucosamine-6-phosphate deacetylase [Desulfosporosinus metallidurans]